jgi:hypothetical protein
VQHKIDIMLPNSFIPLQLIIRKPFVDIVQILVEPTRHLDNMLEMTIIHRLRPEPSQLSRRRDCISYLAPIHFMFRKFIIVALDIIEVDVDRLPCLDSHIVHVFETMQEILSDSQPLASGEVLVVEGELDT